MLNKKRKLIDWFYLIYLLELVNILFLCTVSEKVKI